MRTTVDLDKPLLERAKRRATKQGRTLSHLVREAVSSYLAGEPKDVDEPFELITCGEAGGYAPTPREMAAVLEQEDSPVAPRARRDGDA